MSARALVDERVLSSPYHSLVSHTDMAFLYESGNSSLARLIIRLQREDIGDVARDDEELSFALELQLQELSIAETLVTDRLFAIDCQTRPNRDRELALDLSDLYHEADAAHLTCTGCDSRFTRHQSFKAPCNRHFFCFECLANFFEYTIGDESLYPPTCCDAEISLENVRKLLDDKLVARYEKKKIEYDTEPMKRTYCHGLKCNMFIPESSIENDVATCSDCGKRTCTICNEAAHRGDCPKDEDTQSLLEMAEKEGWQRCYNTKCHRVVALTIGCNHITSVSSALEFCTTTLTIV
ncbi:hypothetical protein D6D01_02924 [Aureobasidium pullulans]|uniref:RBR-type E3 ubiquitin transferase n=1 Tax=Aureobasidium pullulans TaxID=5580 RepID=A0A4S9LQ59_AURPU|nr:hypothetical protein D6D01_02924 [Aureobasidium pullulans]